MSINYGGRIFSAYGFGCIMGCFGWFRHNVYSGSLFFAHNLNFDGSIILSNIDDCVTVSNAVLRGGNIYGLDFMVGNIIIKLKCSAKFFPGELGSIATRLNLPPKLGYDHKFNFDDIQDSLFRSNAIKYCERDAEIVSKLISKIHYSIEPVASGWYDRVLSISGLAMFIFTKNFNNLNINLRLNSDIDKLIRPSYYGGRCEVFGNPLKSDSIHHYDFTLMYTNRLLDDFPIDTGYILKDPIDINQCGFFFVEVSSNLNIPILPHRCKNTKKLLFPNGFFSGLYWHEELELFKKFGGIILKIHWAYVFKKVGPVFKKFAELCCKLREVDKISRSIWKLIPNSFIGRLGLKSVSDKTIVIKDDIYNPLDYNVISDIKIKKKKLTWPISIKIF